MPGHCIEKQGNKQPNHAQTFWTITDLCQSLESNQGEPTTGIGRTFKLNADSKPKPSGHRPYTAKVWFACRWRRVA